MPASAPPRKFADESLDNIAAHPATVLTSSEDAGWTSLYVASLREPGSLESFEPVVTPDQRISLMTGGSCQIESFGNGHWTQANYRPGRGALTAPWHPRRLRWQSDADTVDMVHLFISPEYLDEAAEEYRRAGTPIVHADFDVFGFADPVMSAVAQSLVRGLSRGYLDMYADSAARFLATHLLNVANHWPDYITNRKVGNDLTDRRLSRVLEFVEAYYAEPLRLDDLAEVASISRFHFSRLFKNKVGCTPHQYIVRTRMHEAKTMLRNSDMSVTQVAVACGYSNSSHFAATFFDMFGESPAKYRLSAPNNHKSES